MKLAWYVVRRIAWMIPVLLFLTIITFALAHLAPGSPWDQPGRQLPPNVVHDLNEKYGLDKPVWQQLLIYLWNAIHFDFGSSYQYRGQSVSSLLLESWPYTATLGIVTFVFVVPVGIGAGALAAIRQRSMIDHATLSLATVGASVPNFVFGILLVLLLSIDLNRWTAGNVFLPSGGFGLDQHLIMPVLTLAALPTAYITRLTRTSVLEVLRAEHVRTAWAKGLRERAVVMRHVLKNALMPVVSALGIIFTLLVSGSVIVETVFAIPGIGRSFVNAVEARDYPVILGITLLYAVIVSCANLIVDLLYVAIDPRVRVG